MNLIDHGENDPLEFTPDDTPDETRAWLARHRYEREVARRSDAYKAQLQRWAAIPDATRTDADRAAIAADQARRIRAMGDGK